MENKQMKNSGIEWIGEIPEDWDVRRVKNCFYLSKQKANQKNPTILRLARDGIQVRDISNNEGQLAANYEDYNPVLPGDLLLNPMDLYSGANCNVSEISGVISPAYANLRAFVQLNAKYFDYYFKIQYWTMAMFVHGKGVSYDNRWTINSDTLLAYEIPFPQYKLQTKIVKFLNQKLEGVNNIITNQKAQIEKLKEYKQSIITEAVTKGLVHTASMKDSGLEWIGEIPSHWELNRLKFIATYNDEVISEATNSSTEIQYVDIGSVTLENGIEEIENFTFGEAPSRARRVTQLGDIIISTVRTYLKAIASISYENIIVSTGFCVVRPNKKFVNKYVEYYCKSNIFTDNVSRNSYGISYPAINATALMGFHIIAPPISEQQQIADYLDKKCAEIDKLISIKQQKIEKLQEYKKSLIYEYVTGKKEVS